MNVLPSSDKYSIQRGRGGGRDAVTLSPRKAVSLVIKRYVSFSYFQKHITRFTMFGVTG